ncbi:MAG TPA: response regulator, partial [Dongiaceae bacterium]|nr:response regulator [Dongiaceae bacterium]
MTTPTRQRVYPHHILAIDDKADLLASLKSLLEIHGFRVSTATSTDQAIDSLRKGNFDLVLLDILMPQLSGHEVLRFVQEQRADLPVIVISGDYSFSSVSTALKRGACDFIRKPYVAEELINSIDNALDKRRLEFEFKTMQQRIQQSEKMHRFMVNNSPDIIYILNERGHITFINDSVEKLLNIPKSDVMGNHFSSLTSDDECRNHPFTFNERRASGRKTQNREMHLRKRLCVNGNGSTTTLSV